MNKFFTTILVVLSLAVGFALGHSFFLPTALGATVSSTGATGTTAKQASITAIFATGATSTSILNTDSTDRVITDSFAACTNVGYSYVPFTGSGLNAMTLQAATSSTGVGSSTNNNFAANLSFATSTQIASTTLFASSTLGVLGANSAIWPTATYLQFWTNATNTAQCTVGVHTVSL